MDWDLKRLTNQWADTDNNFIKSTRPIYTFTIKNSWTTRLYQWAYKGCQGLAKNITWEFGALCWGIDRLIKWRKKRFDMRNFITSF